MQQTDGDLSVSAKGSINAEAKTDVSLSGQNTTVDGKTKVTVSGAETLVSGKMTTVQGAAHKIDVM